MEKKRWCKGLKINNEEGECGLEECGRAGGGE
jgi:hypothetical protein